MHICFSAVFLLGTAAHLVFNWRQLVHYFKNRETRRIGFRWEWPAALGLSVLMLVGVRANVPPFSSLLTWRAQFKPGCSEEKGEARGGGKGGGEGKQGTHGGRSGSGGGGGGMGWKTLADFCRDEKIQLSDAHARLTTKGIAATDTQTMREIADANKLDRPTSLAEIVRDTPR